MDTFKFDTNVSKYKLEHNRNSQYFDSLATDICVYSLYPGHFCIFKYLLTLKVLVATIDAQWEGMGDVGSARYEPALLPPCLTIRVLSYSN